MLFTPYDDVFQGTSVDIQSLTGSTAVSGAAYDTEGLDSAMMHVRAAASSGGASPSTVACALFECATSGGTYTAALDNTGTAIGFTLTNTSVGADGFARIEGLGLNRLRFLKIKVTPAFTGGTSPASLVYGEFLAASRNALPVGRATSNT